MKVLLGVAALVLLQLPAGSPASEVLLPDPPAADWIEILDLTLDRDTAAQLGIGDVSEFDDVDAHVRAWSGPEGGVIVAIAVAVPNQATLDGFLSGARASALADGERLDPFPGMPEVERFVVNDEGTPVEATVFGVGSYGFSVQGTAAEGAALVADLTRLQIARAPAAPPPPARDDDFAYRLGRGIGGAVGLAAVGTAAWWWLRRSKRRHPA